MNQTTEERLENMERALTPEQRRAFRKAMTGRAKVLKLKENLDDSRNDFEVGVYEAFESGVPGTLMHRRLKMNRAGLYGIRRKIAERLEG